MFCFPDPADESRGAGRWSRSALFLLPHQVGSSWKGNIQIAEHYAHVYITSLPRGVEKDRSLARGTARAVPGCGSRHAVWQSGAGCESRHAVWQSGTGRKTYTWMHLESADIPFTTWGQVGTLYANEDCSAGSKQGWIPAPPKVDADTR